MSHYDKDNFQKQAAIRHCLATGVVPYLNVVVPPETSVESNVHALSDIDVLGVSTMDIARTFLRTYDCKTVKGSPINRAFWAHGLAQFVGAEESFVILERAAVESHRLAAKRLRVFLFDSKGFEAHAESSSAEFATLAAYAGDVRRWTERDAEMSKIPAVGALHELAESRVPLSRDAAASFRHLLKGAREAGPELDPEKALHLCLYSETVAAAGLLLVSMTADFRFAFDPGASFETFERLVKYYIWGGKDSWELMQRYRRMANANDGAGDFNLPQWTMFLELVRTLLESPNEVGSVPLAVKEQGFRFLAQQDHRADQRLRQLWTGSNRTRQFAFRVSRFVCRACGLPQEFAERFESSVNEVVNSGT